MRSLSSRLALSAVAGLALVTLGGAVPGPVSVAVPVQAQAAPGYVVTLGDSYISGEAGRWAGNTNQSSSRHDALGGDAYYDNAARTAELIERCHRSESAEAHIGGGIPSLNLACSGAKVATYFDGSRFKPGIDFYSDSSGRKGQARMLQEFASANDVDMIVVSIGGNDFNFASIVQSCVTNFLTSPSWWPNYCNDDSSVTSNFTTANVTNRTNAITGALNNVRTAMANAGYVAGSYRIIVQTYPSPIPTSAGFRYSQSGFTRQSTGGCGFWNADANWANNTALARINGAVRQAVVNTGDPNVRVMELQSSFNGRRLCENTVGLLEERGIANWTSPGAVDNTEWINQIRTLSTVFGPYFVQESIHPNYWGQLAVRNCVRQAYNNGSPRGGTCTRTGSGLTTRGEPVMTLS
jgi:hypothetical protein